MLTTLNVVLICAIIFMLMMSQWRMRHNYLKIQEATEKNNEIGYVPPTDELNNAALSNHFKTQEPKDTTGTEPFIVRPILNKAKEVAKTVLPFEIKMKKGTKANMKAIQHNKEVQKETPKKQSMSRYVLETMIDIPRKMLIDV